MLKSLFRRKKRKTDSEVRVYRDHRYYINNVMKVMKETEANIEEPVKKDTRYYLDNVKDMPISATTKPSSSNTKQTANNTQGSIMNTISSPIGIDTDIYLTSDSSYFSEIIPGDTKVPVSASKEYTTVYDNQSSLEFNVIQAANKDSSESKILGDIELTGIPPAPIGVPKIIVTLDVDEDGIVGVSAEILDTGKRLNMILEKKAELVHEDIEDTIPDENLSYEIPETDNVSLEEETETSIERRTDADFILKADISEQHQDILEEPEQEDIEDCIIAEEIENDKTKEKDQIIEEQEKRLKHIQADFANYKKRTAARQNQIEEQAGSALAEQLIPSLEALEAAIKLSSKIEKETQKIKKEIIESMSPMRIFFDPNDYNQIEHIGNIISLSSQMKEGIAQTRTIAVNILESEGLKIISPKVGDKFDSMRHEALARTDSDKTESGTILEVLRDGYEWKDRLLRPASVNVSG